MESTQKLQFLTEEIQRLIEAKKNQEEEEAFGAGADSIPLDHTDRPILSRLLSELESLKGDGTLKQSGSSSSETSSPRGGGESKPRIRKAKSKEEAIDVEEIGKEIKKVKRQNFITHCLLSVLIVVTVAWQVSEVSLALSIKEKLSHPVRSLASAFFGGGGRNQGHDRDGGRQDQERKHSDVETSNGSTMMMPELPRVDFGFSSDDHS